jgi:hypothetical protein
MAALQKLNINFGLTAINNGTTELKASNMGIDHASTYRFHVKEIR